MVRSLQNVLRAAQRSLDEQQRRIRSLDAETERLRARLAAASDGANDPPFGS